ncbi:MAG: selenocysteine-specific translation elongation factor [Spirochaetes bacterium]|jgi:selenocysteine-specific elongation factor|nr:selenocysteine-specific translation elongation factor [Spirochaetota bacterium]
MYIVGTSGHIDHGKTSLIRALTGIDCDRLPEEKAREMTIDIGFASIDYPKFGTVGIIDVPGHERFIRNMVVGAWGVDLAILVIAVDDGWMPQTEDHFRVLMLLGVERIVVALNKIDAADEEMISFVSAEVEERMADTRYAGCDIVRVSAKTGDGVAELKEVLLANLRKLARAADARKPYLFVDRVFASKGYGTIVTGTLKNGRFNEDDPVLILPLMREVRVKKIESHHSALEEGVPSQRTALNISGVTVEEIGRGDIVTGKNFFTRSADVVVRVRLLEKKAELKNNTGMEMLVGTTALKGKLILLDDEDRGEEERVLRIKFDVPWFFYPGQRFIITHPGGFRIIGGGEVLLPDYLSAGGRRNVRRHLPVFSKYTRDEFVLFIVAVRRAVAWSWIVTVFPENERAVERVIESLIERGAVVRAGDFLLEGSFHAEALARVAETIAGSIGPNLREIADKTGLDMDICRVVLPAVIKKHRIVEKDGRFFGGDSITVDALPDEKKAVLDTLRGRGLEGAELDKSADEAEKRNLGDLIRLGFAVSLDGNIVLHREVYDELRQKVMALFDDKDRISIAEAKDATSFSRKYIIPLLNRIEGDGLIKRIGDFRMKA